MMKHRELLQCRVCECTVTRGCHTPCFWVEEDLCSECLSDDGSPLHLVERFPHGSRVIGWEKGFDKPFVRGTVTGIIAETSNRHAVIQIRTSGGSRVLCLRPGLVRMTLQRRGKSAQVGDRPTARM
jgi:hypothetical protein